MAAAMSNAWLAKEAVAVHLDYDHGIYGMYEMLRGLFKLRPTSML